MRLIIIFEFLIFGLGANAQIKMLNILESYPVPNQPEVISVDTSIIIDYINPIETSNNSDSTLMIRLKDYEIRIVRSDSSILRFFLGSSPRSRQKLYHYERRSRAPGARRSHATGKGFRGFRGASSCPTVGLRFRRWAGP